LHIAELNYTEMIDNELCTGASTIQKSGVVVNSTWCNWGGKGHRRPDYPSKKIGGTAASRRNAPCNISQVLCTPLLQQNSSRQWSPLILKLTEVLIQEYLVLGSQEFARFCILPFIPQPILLLFIGVTRAKLQLLLIVVPQNLNKSYFNSLLI